MLKLDLEKAEESEINCQHLLDHQKSKRVQKNIYFCFIDSTKPFDFVDHNKLWKILQEMGILEHRTCHLINLYADQEARIRTGHVTTNCFQIGKEVCQDCILSYCLITYMQSTSCEIPGYMKNKLESRLPEET